LACRTHVESNGGQQHQHDQGQQREQPQHGHQNKPAVILTKKPRIAPDREHWYYHEDHLHSTAMVTNEKSQLVDAIHYFPYGEVWLEERPSSLPADYFFTAKEFDPETGFLQLRGALSRSAVLQVDDGRSGAGRLSEREQTRPGDPGTLYLRLA